MSFLFSDVMNNIHDASGITKGSFENYLWFQWNGVYYPDLSTYQADPYPENYYELCDGYQGDDPRPQYE